MSIGNSHILMPERSGCLITFMLGVIPWEYVDEPYIAKSENFCVCVAWLQSLKFGAIRRLRSRNQDQQTIKNIQKNKQFLSPVNTVAFLLSRKIVQHISCSFNLLSTY